MNVNYDGNTQTTDECNQGSDLCPSCTQYSITCTVTGLWTYNNDLLGYTGFEDITDQNACVYNDTAYVEFVVDSVGDNEGYQSVWARYGDDHCGAGASQAVAWKHSTKSTWNTKFYVGDMTGGDFYWRGKATLCDSTILGQCTQKTLRQCKDIPIWWEEISK